MFSIQPHSWTPTLCQHYSELWGCSCGPVRCCSFPLGLQSQAGRLATSKNWNVGSAMMQPHRTPVPAGADQPPWRGAVRRVGALSFVFPLGSTWVSVIQDSVLSFFRKSYDDRHEEKRPINWPLGQEVVLRAQLCLVLAVFQNSSGHTTIVLYVIVDIWVVA